MNNDAEQRQHTLYHHLNAFVLLTINGILLFAFYDQFFKHELPCPLCLLQRLGFAACMFPIILNIRYGIRAWHYGLFLLSCVFGAAIALRQISLHVIPNTPTYGASFLGYHFYTWAFIAYTALIIVTGIALLMPNQLVPQSQPILFKQQPLWIKLVLSLTLVVILGNAVSAFLECGLGACDDNPVEYELLSKINLFLYTNGWNHHFF